MTIGSGLECESEGQRWLGYVGWVRLQLRLGLGFEEAVATLDFRRGSWVVGETEQMGKERERERERERKGCRQRCREGGVGTW